MTTYINPPDKCDVCRGSFGSVMYDATTTYGPWANMCHNCYTQHHKGGLGTGKGQKYHKSGSGEWVKVEG